MARQSNRLNTRSVAALSKPGRHSDGAGLYLVIDHGGAKRWAFIFRWQGKLKEMGLGGLKGVSLARARELAVQARTTLAGGSNPIEARRQQRASTMTFGEMADQLIESLAPSWRHPKHHAQWKMTMRVYARPLHLLPVDRVTTEDVLKVLKPIWSTKPETASRVRGRIERVLDAAKALGHRSGENPAAWRGHLKNLLPKRHALSRGHHPAMPFTRIPEFMAELRKREAVAARALEFTILTASRTTEVLGATWAEYDAGNALWVIPAGRMKGGREHRVPLPVRTVEILTSLKAMRTETESGSYLFPGQQRHKPLSNMAMDMLLRRMAESDVTIHGFRSTFRDWAGERSTFPSELAEAALAHLVGDETERAYRRGDALEKRRKLMDAWSAFCAALSTGNVIPISKRK